MSAFLFTYKFSISDKPDQKMSKRIERLRQATVAYEVFEHSSTFSAPVDVNDPQFAHLRSLVDSEVTSFLVALLKNYLLALAINKKHLSKNGKIGKSL